MPVAPELTITPDVVLMFNAPKVEIAWMPFDVVPVTVAPPPIAILRGPVPPMRALIPTVPDTLPKSMMSVEPVPEFVTMPAAPDEVTLPALMSEILAPPVARLTPAPVTEIDEV